VGDICSLRIATLFHAALLTMKFSTLAALSFTLGSAAAEIYLKEQFNDEVR
jgi:hypothetical protein